MGCGRGSLHRLGRASNPGLWHKIRHNFLAAANRIKDGRRNVRNTWEGSAGRPRCRFHEPNFDVDRVALEAPRTQVRNLEGMRQKSPGVPQRRRRNPWMRPTIRTGRTNGVYSQMLAAFAQEKPGPISASRQKPRRNFRRHRGLPQSWSAAFRHHRTSPHT